MLPSNKGVDHMKNILMKSCVYIFSIFLMGSCGANVEETQNLTKQQL